MKKKRITFRSTISLLTALITVLVLQGCGLTVAQKKVIDDFSSATTVAGKAAVSELATMREEVIAMNVARIQLKGVEKDKPGLDKLDEAFTLEATAVRQQAAEAIRSYGELLKTLANTDRTEDIKKSTDDLLSSYEGLPDSYKTLKKDELDAIAKALQAVGGFWVERKKAAAVKAVVNGSNSQITKLCTMLEADFDPYRDGKLGSQFLKTTDDLRVVADEVLEKSKGFSERAAATAAFERAQANVLRRDNVEKVLSESIGSIAKANTQLVQVVNSREYSSKDVEALQKNVKLLYDAIKVLRN